MVKAAWAAPIAHRIMPLANARLARPRPQLRSRGFPQLATGALLALVSLIVCYGKAESDEPQSNAESVTELRRAEGIWADWRRNAKTLQLKGSQFFGDSDGQSEAFVRRDLLEFVNETVIPALDAGVRDLEDLKALTAPIFSDPGDSAARGRPVGNWRPYEFAESAGKRRTDLKLLGTISRVRKDGVEEQFDSGARQVSLFPSQTGIHMEQIPDFVFTPYGQLQKLAWSLDRRGGKCRLKASLSDVIYDEQTGFIEHCVMRARDDWYVRERFQAAPIMTSAGIPIPKFIAEATFWRGGDAATAPVHWLHMYVIDEISLNDAIDPAVFALAVPPGTNIVKFSSADNNLPVDRGGTRPAMHRVVEPIADAGKFAKSAEFDEPPRPRSGPAPDLRGSGWTWDRTATVAVGAVFLAFLLLWVRRRRSTGPAHPE